MVVQTGIIKGDKGVAKNGTELYQKERLNCIINPAACLFIILNLLFVYVV